MHDQIEAACAEVKTYVANLQLHPPQGAHFAHMDGTIERAVMNRMSRDMAAGELFTCCHRVNFPRMLYYVPRHRALFCQEHWNQVRMCECFEECDACEMPISTAKMVYMFVGPYIIQAIICGSCGDHLRLSPTGG